MAKTCTTDRLVCEPEGGSCCAACAHYLDLAVTCCVVSVHREILEKWQRQADIVVKTACATRRLPKCGRRTVDLAFFPYLSFSTAGNSPVIKMTKWGQKKLAEEILQQECLFFFLFVYLEPQDSTAETSSIQRTEEETVLASRASCLMLIPPSQRKNNLWNASPVITTQKPNNVLTFEQLKLRAVLALYPAEGYACRRRDVCLCFRCRRLMWEEVMDAISLLCYQQLKTAAKANRWEFLAARCGRATEGDETGGLCFTMLYCSAEDKEKELGGPTATNVASPRLHPPGDPALIGSLFGRVTFPLCGQLHLRHAHLRTQDDGGVGIAAERRLVLTWRTEDTSQGTTPCTAEGWPYSTASPSKTLLLSRASHDIISVRRCLKTFIQFIAVDVGTGFTGDSQTTLKIKCAWMLMNNTVTCLPCWAFIMEPQYWLYHQPDTLSDNGCELEWRKIFYCGAQLKGLKPHFHVVIKCFNKK